MTAPRKPARTGAAPQGWQAAFFVSLRQTGNVSAAARAAGTCKSRFHQARQRDRSFVAAQADALKEAADRLEMEVLWRAVEGIDEDRNFRGDLVGSVTRYSDRLLMFLLEARQPSKFGSGAEAQAAAAEALDSRWVAQTGRQADDIARLLRGA